MFCFRISFFFPRPPPPRQADVARQSTRVVIPRVHPSSSSSITTPDVPDELRADCGLFHLGGVHHVQQQRSAGLSLTSPVVESAPYRGDGRVCPPHSLAVGVRQSIIDSVRQSIIDSVRHSACVSKTVGMCLRLVVSIRHSSSYVSDTHTITRRHRRSSLFLLLR